MCGGEQLDVTMDARWIAFVGRWQVTTPLHNYYATFLVSYGELQPFSHSLFDTFSSVLPLLPISIKKRTKNKPI